LQIIARRTEGTAILDIAGDINLEHSREVRNAMLLEIRDKHTQRVVLNLTGVRRIDSSGIASLVEGLKASRESGSRLILYGLSSFAYEVLKLSRLVDLFEIYDTEEKALAAVK
jgi:anti-sigma B factor antagonist